MVLRSVMVEEIKQKHLILKKRVLSFQTKWAPSTTRR